MIFHPRFVTLSDYADGELPDGRRARVSRHLARCPRCRASVVSIRDWSRDAAALTKVTPPSGALERILAQQAEGRSVILPVADPRPSSWLPHPVWRAAALVVVVGAAVVVARPGGELDAANSLLMGNLVDLDRGRDAELTYRSSPMFAGHERLVVRGHVRGRYDELNGVAAVVTGHLMAGNGRREYRGAIRLPDSAVYATLVVEDVRGELLDQNAGQPWEILETVDGRPSADALHQKTLYQLTRNAQRALEAASLGDSLYPHDARFPVFVLLLRGIAPWKNDSLRAEYEQRLDQLAARAVRDEATEDELADLAQFAAAIRPHDAPNEWLDRLSAANPGHARVIQARVNGIDASVASPRDKLREYEELWVQYGSTYAGLMTRAFDVAWSLGLPDEMRLWISRGERTSYRGALQVAHQFLAVDGGPSEGIARLRELIKRIDTEPAAHRPLDKTTGQQRAAAKFVKREAMVALGRALIERGDVTAGVDTLEVAASLGWDPFVFKAAAEARFATGDTLGGVRWLARVVSDPLVSAGAKDSARAFGTAVLGTGRWRGLVDSARIAMRLQVLRESMQRTIDRTLPLVREGRPVTLDDALNDQVTLVAHWPADCPVCEGDMEQLLATARLVNNYAGAQALMIVGGPSSGDPWDQQTETLPVFIDVNMTAHRFLESWQGPDYLVLDSRGAVRYQGSVSPDLVRLVDALVASESGEH